MLSIIFNYLNQFFFLSDFYELLFIYLFNQDGSEYGLVKIQFFEVNNFYMGIKTEKWYFVEGAEVNKIKLKLRLLSFASRHEDYFKPGKITHKVPKELNQENSVKKFYIPFNCTVNGGTSLAILFLRLYGFLHHIEYARRC